MTMMTMMVSMRDDFEAVDWLGFILIEWKDIDDMYYSFKKNE
jgi:hypothetical protein